MDKIEMLREKQNKLSTLLEIKLSKKEVKMLREIVSIEYTLTMVEEGHDLKDIN